MQALHDAIKSKYGVSDAVSSQVVAALAEVERHRQDSTGGQAQGFRARKPGETSTPQSIPDIATIIGSQGGGSSRSTSVSASGSGLIGIILSILQALFSLFMSNQRNQNSGAVTNILNDLLGGATHPSQAPDLNSVLGNLLGGSAGGQSLNINDLAQSVLNNHPSGGQGKLIQPRSSQRGS